MRNDVMESRNENFCVACKDESEDDLATITPKGYLSLYEYSVQFNHEKPGLSSLLEARKAENKIVRIHRGCQKRIGRLMSKRKSDNDVKYGYMPSPKKTRAQGSFTWPEDCFYCGAAAQQDRKNINRRSSVVRRVQSLAFKQNVLSVCDAADDSWSNEVRLRVINCHDFVAVKARYHLQCHDKFNVSVLNQSSSSSSNSNNQSLLTESLDISKNAGRPIDPMKHSIRHT